MAWWYLFLAAIFEMGWPLGFKLSQNSDAKIFWIIFAVVAMALSGYFLYIAQKQIPIGIAYAVWTGIGMLGTFLVGIAFFNDGFSLVKLLGIFLILSGVIILRLS